MNKLRVCHLFSGIGAPETALDRLHIKYENVGFSEIDKFAIKSYIALHGNKPYLGGVEDIKELPECDLLFYGSPCQDFSIGGQMKGLVDEEGNKTRSGLLLDVERLLDTAKANSKLPSYLIMENVKNLVGTKFKPDFDRWLDKLEELGYNNYWQVLNAKDYGIPQNRERVFVISIRKDIDEGEFEFPKPFKLQRRLKDLLENGVAEHYYLNQHTLDKIAKSKFHSERDRIVKGDVCQTLRARDYKDPVCVKEPINGATRTRYEEDGTPYKNLESTGEPLSNTLTTQPNDALVIEPKVQQIANYLEGEGNYWKNPNNGRIYSGEGLAPTLNCMEGGNRQPKVVEGDENFEEQFRVRKLTEGECWRLMGFSDEAISKVKEAGISRSQMYKQAGNSIVVDVLYYIFRSLLTRPACCDNIGI